MLSQLHQTVLIQITQTYVISSLATLTADGYIVSLRRSPFTNHVVIWIEVTHRELTFVSIHVPVTTIYERIINAQLASILAVPFFYLCQVVFCYIPECTSQCRTSTLQCIHTVADTIYTCHFEIFRDILPREVTRIVYCYLICISTLL